MDSLNWTFRAWETFGACLANILVGMARPAQTFEWQQNGAHPQFQPVAVAVTAAVAVVIPRGHILKWLCCSFINHSRFILTNHILLSFSLTSHIWSYNIPQSLQITPMAVQQDSYRWEKTKFKSIKLFQLQARKAKELKRFFLWITIYLLPWSSEMLVTHPEKCRILTRNRRNHRKILPLKQMKRLRLLN